MLRLRLSALLVALFALAVAPAVAHATVTQSQVTSWVSSDPGTPANNPYLMAFDNPPTPTTLTVSGTSNGTTGDRIAIVCFYGDPSQSVILQNNLLVNPDGSFATVAGSPPKLQLIAGHACRLRAVPAGSGTNDDGIASFAGPQVAVSQVALLTIPGGRNSGVPYSFLVNGTTFTGDAGWGPPGNCGPYAAPVDSNFTIGNFAINCAGSLLNDDLGAFGGRSEVQIDGRNAYDAASAQSLFARTSGDNGSEDLPGFPSLTESIRWDPATGLVSSQSTETWVQCAGADQYKPTIATCTSFLPTGVQLQRDITTSAGGRVVTMTDTWSSTDAKVHAVDLLYDDFVGLNTSSAERAFEFPGQSTFSTYLDGDSVPGSGAAPGSIFVHTNAAAADGNPAEAFGAITYSSAPSAFTFAPQSQPPVPPPASNELEEHQVLVVPAGASTSLTYVYSVGYSVADVQALALAAQDQFQGPSIVIGSPASGSAVTTPTVSVAGITSAGSGIASLAVAGQPVPVGPDGTWTAQVPLSPGSNTITALATDGAGATAQAQLAVTYNPPPAPPPRVRCVVPKTKGMKVPVAEKALRRAHCKVGRITHVKSRTLRRGRVMRTNPHAGRTLAAGAKVDLFVSKGR